MKAPSGLAVALLESLPRGVLVIDGVAADRPILYANDAYLAHSGYTPEALVSRPLTALMPTGAATDRVAWQAALDRVRHLHAVAERAEDVARERRLGPEVERLVQRCAAGELAGPV